MIHLLLKYNTMTLFFPEDTLFCGMFFSVELNTVHHFLSACFHLKKKKIYSASTQSVSLR